MLNPRIVVRAGGLSMLTLALLNPLSLRAEEPDPAAAQRHALDSLIESLQFLRATPEATTTALARIDEESKKLQADLAALDDQLQQLTQQLDTSKRKKNVLSRRLAALHTGRELLTAETATRPAETPPPPAASKTPEPPPPAQPAAAQPAPAAATPAPAVPPNDPNLALFVNGVRPALEQHCFKCHGGEFKKSGFDLTSRETLLTGGDEGPAVVPGKADQSLLYQLITHQKEPFMPQKADKLPDDVIAKIKQWIDAGAPYDRPLGVAPGEQADAAPQSDHWAFQPRKHPAVPDVNNQDWPRNEIDRFILARLEKEGITPSPEADRPTLLRRLSLDLTGLPPTPAELDDFVNDARPDAYDRVVDRLLASPHFGERWGRHWLDLARYADSDGYEKDSPRPWAWRYRNWVIDAVNRDLPFDQFTLQQLAGDLLPDAGIEQRVATGFHRNTLTNKEGGVDPEEYRVKALVDRVATTSTVWLGLTMNCAECHSHKYDPITQREFYGMFAFFNQADEQDVPAPLPQDAERYQNDVRAFNEVHRQLQAAVTAYDQHELPIRLREWEPKQKLHAWQTLTPTIALSTAGATLTPQDDGSVLVSGTEPDADAYIVTLHSPLERVTAVRVEALPHPSLPSGGPGRSPNGNFVLSELHVKAAPSDDPLASSVLALQNPTADHEQQDWPVAAVIDGDPKKGWGILPRRGERHVAVFEIAQPVTHAGGTILTLKIEQNFGAAHVLGRFRVSVTADPHPVRATPLPDDLAGILRLAHDKRPDAQNDRLTSYFKTVDPGRANLVRALDDHNKQSPANDVVKAQTIVRTPTPRVTHVHVRGDFLRPGDAVPPLTPAILPPLHARGETPDRVDLAQWLVAPDNPLTSRVAANHVWQHLFGQGLVPTAEDFGTRGDPPSHPELLDWLAGEYIARGWSRKAMIKLIVSSATYRQSSNYRPDLNDRDPKNLLLARQNRFRLSAETVRDVSLAASGLLYPKIGGPSIRPPQPKGISELTYAGSASWQESPAPDKYRRGLYIWFQRTSPYPMLTTFDAPDANVTCTRRERSNTPLQSLTLLNSPVFFECAQHLGRRVVHDMDDDPDARVRHLFRLCLAREPTADEIARTRQLYDDLIEICRKDPKAAANLLAETGTSANDPKTETPDDTQIKTAAWIIVGRTILNLDETVTRS